MRLIKWDQDLLDFHEPTRAYYKNDDRELVFIGTYNPKTKSVEKTNGTSTPVMRYLMLDEYQIYLDDSVNIECRDCGEYLTMVVERLGELFASCFTCKSWSEKVEKPPAGPQDEYMMRFGKHAWESLNWIFSNDASYLFWASKNLTGATQKRISMFLEGKKNGLQAPDFGK